MTLMQLISLIGALASGVLTTGFAYWKLDSKQRANNKEIKDLQADIKYDIEQRFAILGLERRTCNERHEHKFTQMEIKADNTEKKMDIMLLTQNEQLKLLQELTKNITALNTKFEKHETYHETLEKIKK